MGMTRVIITGGGGFLGQHLARALLRRGYAITIVDDFHRGQALPNDLGQSCDIVIGDITKELLPLDTDILIHAAAIAGVQTVVNEPKRVLDVNLMGTQRVLEAVTCKQVLFFSTSEVYGPHCYKAKESDALSIGPLTEPRWVYAASKLAGEHLVAACGRPWTIIRPFNVYGPGQLGDGAIGNFVKQAKAGGPLVVHGDGTQVRSWCYVSDCIAAVVAMVENPVAYGHVFNVGNPQATVTTLDLAQRIAARFSVGIAFKGITYSEIDLRVPDITNATTLLHWHPVISLEEGLDRTCVS
jgi:nucleoside-diphosphate-sugar epimerase